MLTNKRTANLIILLLFQLKSFSRPVKSVQVAETTHKYTRERKMSNLVQKAAQLLLSELAEKMLYFVRFQFQQ